MRMLLPILLLVFSPAADAAAQGHEPPAPDSGRAAGRTTAGGAAASEHAPRYMQAIDAELTAIGIAHDCEAVTSARAHCAWQARGRTSQRSFSLHLSYSDETDTIYLYVARYLQAPADDETTLPLLRRLMELNWQLLVGKFEWDANAGEIRLTMTLNTDSNFDRRAFRSVVRQLSSLADRYSGELSRMLPRSE